jgi:anaphase-promoting complex subunit 8
MKKPKKTKKPRLKDEKNSNLKLFSEINSYPKVNMSSITTALASAAIKCSDRGLRVSSEFSAEMLVASTTNDSYTTTTTDTGNEPKSYKYLLAKACFDRGEYLRAAHTLRNIPLAEMRDSSKSQIDNTTPGSDVLAYFLRCYSLYLAGEKRREEVQAERGGPSNHWSPGMSQTTTPSEAPDPSNGQGPALSVMSGAHRQSSGNENLALLYGEMTNLYKEGRLIDGFLLYLYGIVLRDLGMPEQAQATLCESVVAYSLNWSAWLDLAALCPDRASLEKVEDIVQQLRTSGGSSSITAETEWIVKCFKGHTLMEQQEHENAISIFEELLQTFHNSTYIRSALAKTHYNALQYDQSKKFYEDLRSNDPYRLDGMDLYSNILFVKGLRAPLSHLAHEAMKIDKYRPQTCCIVGNYYSLKGKILFF